MEAKPREHTGDEPSKQPYQLIKQITNDFHESRILGKGGFGTVYKGVYDDGREIAVKVLHNTITSGRLPDKEFQKEFDNLRKLKHPNIIKLVGFCNETEQQLLVVHGEKVPVDCLHMALCFDYAHNGSLQKRISDPNTRCDWHTSYRIIKGICQGLQYLHEGLESPIIHLDLKPHNILLDKNMTPTIADFGISRLFGQENTKQTLTNVGTIGYWPPEFLKHQILSKEFDIFSLGVIIIKIMTGEEGYNSTVVMAKRKAIKIVHESWRKQLCLTLRHASLEVYCNQVKACMEIALDCLKSNRQERPNINDIVSSLNETETIIGDRKVQYEQFNQDDAESTLPFDVSNIAINSRPATGEPRVMSFSLLKEMTDNFSEERLISRTSHGRVYKGVYGDGQIVAVEMIHAFNENMIKQHSIELLMRSCHQNIVQFIGYCHEIEHVAVQYGGKYVLAEEQHNFWCFEYLPNGSLAAYISDVNSGFDWWTRYGIIYGICEGLKYLHEGAGRPIIHMDLTPQHIMMDEKMAPKIGHIGYATLVGVENNNHKRGTIGYMPPEFIERQVISTKYDIYSLGVIMIELVTGSRTGIFDKSTEELIELAHEEWRVRLTTTLHRTSVEGYCQQVKQCLAVAVKCMNVDSHKRPAIGEIINMLSDTQTLIPLELLDVRPLELGFFPFMPMELTKETCSCRNKLSQTGILISSSLQLHNKGDDRVAFMLVANRPSRYLTKTPLCGIVPPTCVNTLILTMHDKMPPSSDFFTLYCVALGEYDLQDVDKDYNNFFKIAKETTRDEVQVVTLSVLCYQQPCQGTSCEIVATTSDGHQVSSIDVHPTEPWIVGRNDMGIHLLNYRTRPHACPRFSITENDPVNVIKFMAREGWLIMGGKSGQLHVLDYHQHKHVKSFRAHKGCITILVVHPTRPFVLSSSDGDGHLIKLWDWRNNWKCTQFQGHTNKVTQIIINLEDNESFASASLDGTVKIWSFSSGKTITMKLNGNVPDGLLCAAYFTRRERQHLIVGSKDKTALIWDVGKQKCVDALEGHADSISVVKLHTELPLLITGSLDGTVRVWNSTTYKLENIIDFNLGAVCALECIKGSTRVVVVCRQGMAKVDVSSR
ncbi:unnamed protein product [Alopecurus aequalis]